MWQMHDMGAGLWLVMAVTLAAFVAAVIWLVLNSRRSDSSTAPASQPETAMAILDRRLAADEITIEDYEQRRRIVHRDREQTAA